MKEIMSEALDQDFTSHAVLGRVFFGVSFLILGLYSILNAKMFAGNAPSFVPDMLGPVLVIATACVFIGGGFGIASGKAVGRGALAIALVWAGMAIFTNLLSSYFDVREFFIAMAFIGASLTLKAQADVGAVGASRHTPTPNEKKHDGQQHHHHGHHSH